MKNIFKLCLCAVLLSSFASAVYADGMLFEPLEVNNANAVSANKTTTSSTQKTSFFDKFKTTDKVADMSLKENQKMQSALTDLDASQIDLRQSLQEKTTKYNTVEGNYVQVKAERAALKKELKTLNRKLKNIEKAKKTIRKNML